MSVTYEYQSDCIVNLTFDVKVTEEKDGKSEISPCVAKLRATSEFVQTMPLTHVYRFDSTLPLTFDIKVTEKKDAKSKT